MSDPTPIRLGVLLWNQYTDWPSMRDHAARADELGFDSLWTWDHLYPIQGAPDGPMFEAYTVLGGWSGVTSRATLGLLVGANTFRNPALVVKQITTLDHVSDGRAVLGLGAAWFEDEHRAFGLDFGASLGERLARLDESVDLMRQMLRTGVGTARGDAYQAVNVWNEPRPIQPALPILIGGGGERKTLQTVARYADMWNISGVPAEEAIRKRDVLYDWCRTVGRDPAEIELTVSLGPVFIRDDPGEAAKVVERYRAHNGGAERTPVTGSADEITAHAQAFVDGGFRHVIYYSAAPFDAETMERFATDVRPALR